MTSRPEKVEERKFCSKVRALGAETLKQGGKGPYGMGGYNDQLCLCPYGTPVFLEFKADDEEPTARQQSRHRLLKKLGYQTFVVYRAAQAFKICRRLMRHNGVPKEIYARWR